jgi:uncharacterized membrane protein YedE/YeeE
MDVVKALGTAFLAGGVFSAGLTLAGMTRPSKVLAFLDLFGAWDPSLMLVMVGAIGVHGVYWALQGRRERTVLGDPVERPPSGRVDLRLLGGAALFGVGWGLGGYCPGPAVASLGALSRDALVFVVAMVLGMAVWDRVAPSPR